MEKSFKKPAFDYLGHVVSEDKLVDRIYELDELVKTITSNKGNVLLAGERRIGKSSLVRKAQALLEMKKVLTIRIDIRGYDENPEGFLEEILHILCYEIALKIFDKTPTDMLLALTEDKASTFKSKDFKKLFEIFKLLRVSNKTNVKNSSAQAGVNFLTIGNAEANKSKQQSFAIGELTDYEFIHIAQELISICQKSGFRTVTVIADEANHLAVKANKEFLRHYLEVFTERKVLFVFVTDISLIDYKPFKDIFDVTIKLTPFRNISDLNELLEKYVGADYNQIYPEIIVKEVWARGKGHPYISQILFHNSLEEALKQNKYTVEIDDILRAWSELLESDKISDVLKGLRE
ncbi:hypothetical protein [Candidatus Leptofilum sp.]|uniref:hypothetical protein n=1 Tax=Candidatus Leptofilum sp. TaxID=3241576 RepID=UPI003B5B8B29